jgi:hypothetical protein
MIRPLKVLNAVLLMLARRSRRFLRLAQEKPLTLSLLPPPRRLLGLSRFLIVVSSKESVETDPPTEEET